MGKIYRAEQVPLGRPVALKVLRTRFNDEEGDDPQFQKRFFLEASILSKLQHGNIVTLYDYGRIEGVEGEQFFMAMEYLAGDTLARRLKVTGALDPRDAIRIVRGVARGLREAHRLGIVHRDLKPSNIMLVPEEDGGEVVKVLDFGIGKVLEDDAQQELTAEGAFLGSPRYMSPEQIGEGRADARSDVYSLGVMMYECLCGRIPFEGDTNINTMMAHCNSPVPPMRARNPGVTVPEALESLARHLLEKDPAMRPQSMEALVRELGLCEQGLAGGSFQTTSSGPMSAHTPALPPSNHDAPTTTSSFPQMRPSIPGAPATGTHRTITRSQFPSSAPAMDEKKRSTALLVIAPLLLLAGAAAAVFFATRGGTTPDPTALAAPAATNSAPTVTAARTSYMVQVHSTPAGAEVFEGDKVIGNTPLSFAIDRATVRGGTRTFIVRYEGYAPFTFVRGDSEGDEVVVATLVANAVAAAPSASAMPPAASSEKVVASRRWVPPPAVTTAGPSTAVVPTTRPEPDIKLKR